LLIFSPNMLFQELAYYMTFMGNQYIIQAFL